MSVLVPVPVVVPVLVPVLVLIPVLVPVLVLAACLEATTMVVLTLTRLKQDGLVVHVMFTYTNTMSAVMLTMLAIAMTYGA